jgi:FAD/FMN-containing dehydrogenase
MEEILKVVKNAGATDVGVPNKERWAELEAFREIETIRLREQGKLNLIGDVLDVPLEKLAEALGEAIRIEERIARDNPGVVTYNMGHIGSGSFHPSVAAPVAWGYDRLKTLARDIRKEFLQFKLAFGASIGEQGIFPNHREWFVGHYGRAQWELVKAIKRSVDPNNILNPMRLSENLDT